MYIFRVHISPAQGQVFLGREKSWLLTGENNKTISKIDFKCDGYTRMFVY